MGEKGKRGREGKEEGEKKKTKKTRILWAWSNLEMESKWASKLGKNNITASLIQGVETKDAGQNTTKSKKKQKTKKKKKEKQKNRLRHTDSTGWVEWRFYLKKLSGQENVQPKADHGLAHHNGIT